MSEDTAVKQKGDFKSKRNIILIILIAIIIVFVGILNYFTSKNLYNGKIAQNIYIEDVNVSNMTKQEALETIDAKYPTKKVNLSYNNEYYTIEPNQVDLSYDTKDVVDSAYDLKLIEFAKVSLENKTKVTGDFKIKNINRTVGTMLSGEIAKRYGAEGLPDDTITLNLTGSTGQSFMAFGMKGITINLTGECNDYVGKGLSGAKIKVKLPKECTVKSDENIIVGNTVLYGATSGEFYANGKAGERFAVRNSGATAVVEGVGDHGCEYMTGGTVVILGDIGRNFAAGMSGGKVFVYDPKRSLNTKLNPGVLDTSDIENILDTEDEGLLKYLIERHFEYTQSKKSKMILDNWNKEKLNILRVIPKVYKKLISEYQVV